MAHKPFCDEIAGIDLIGYRQPDGSIILGTLHYPGAHLPDFPMSIEVAGAEWTLEAVRKNRDESDLQPDHPGYPIEWGVYV